MTPVPCAYELIPFNPDAPAGHIRELRIERRSVDPEAWAIVGEGHVLSMEGYWIREPRPSNRGHGFLTRCRWPSADAAIAFALGHMERYPSGEKPEGEDQGW